MARLFVAVWPPQPVLEVLRAMPRRQLEGVRWTTEDQWHVTLRFLRAVPEDDIPSLETVLAAAAGAVEPVDVTMGRAVRRIGRTIAATVDELEAVATPVIEATAGFADPPESRRFTGHLTLARVKDRGAQSLRRRWPRVEATWRVDEIALVQSHLGQGPGRAALYETIARYRLGG